MAGDPLVARDYIESYLRIKTKTGEVVPFRLNRAQEKLYAVAKAQQDAGKPVRIIILKARQLGFSTLAQGLIFHGCATHRNVNGLIVAHREDATANLFRMSKLFYDELPPMLRPMLKNSNSEELVFENPSRSSSEKEARQGLRSRLRCTTAGGKGIGRSDTLQYVHLSEYAFWPEGSEGKGATLSGILQAVPSLPGTMVIIESTANGYDDFKSRWDAAVNGENDFEAVFFAWFENDEYRMAVPPGTEWTPDERELQAQYFLTDEQLQWRRWCIANNCGGDRDLFRQEYPASADEAFLHSGTGVFDNALLCVRREAAPEPIKRGRFILTEDSGEASSASFVVLPPGSRTSSFPALATNPPPAGLLNASRPEGEGIAWEDDELGAIRIYEAPREGVPYVIGGDTAGEGSDYFTAIVIDNVTGKQVATLRQQFSEPEYAMQMYALGRYYNNALIGIETNYSTYPVMKLAEMGYPIQYVRERPDTYTGRTAKSYGFRTDAKTRPRAIATLVEIFSAHPDWFCDRELLGEMLTFCYNEDHRPEALAGKHDDMVMACAICYAIRHQQSTTASEHREKPPEKLITKLERQQRRVKRRF